MNAENTGTRGGWIIFWLIVFWPVGLFLLIRRLGVDRSALFKSSKQMTIASYVLIGLAILMMIAAFSPSSGGSGDTEGTSTGGVLAIAVVFGAGGAVLNWYARGLKARAERYRTYIALVVNQQQTSIDNIAAAVGTSYDAAAKELQKMIQLDYFPGAYLDVTQREIVLPTPVPQAAFAGAPAMEARIVACGGCGANNRLILGRSTECEYCGAPLQ